MQIITEYVHPIFAIESNGYLPLKSEMDTMKIKKSDEVVRKPEYDQTKLDYLVKLIDDAKDVKICFVASPIWYGMNRETFKPINDICIKKHIPFIDFSNNSKYVQKNKYFSDGSHLNELGADEFTKDLVAEIKKIK